MTPQRRRTILRLRLGDALLWTALLAAIVGAGCTTTRIEHVWQAPDVAGGFTSVGVIGLARRASMRTYHEENFVERLEAVGIRARASAPDLPDTEALDRETVQAWAREHDLETVLTTRLVDVQKEEWRAPVDGTSYWSRPHRGAGETDVQFVTYQLESQLFEVRDARLLFTARTESAQSVSPDSVVLGVIDTLVRELSERGLLVPFEPETEFVPPEPEIMP
jgi:hypothetical protein